MCFYLDRFLYFVLVVWELVLGFCLCFENIFEEFLPGGGCNEHTSGFRWIFLGSMLKSHKSRKESQQRAFF